MANLGLKEKTLVIVKPDGVRRGIVGEVISRFEKTGLKLVGLKLIKVDKAQINRHYPDSDEWLETLGKKSLADYEKLNLDPVKELGTKDPVEIGKMVKGWLIDYLSSGPVVAMVLEGNQAVENVRMIAGNTLPAFAQPGTIRGDFSVDSASLANAAKRAVKNIIHASGSLKEAEHEINLWFATEEIHSYKRAEEEAMF